MTEWDAAYDAADLDAAGAPSLITRAGWPRTDLGNARRLAAANGDRMIHIRTRGWAVWVGSHFEAEAGEVLANRRAQALSKLIEDEAAAIDAAGPTEADEAAARREVERLQLGEAVADRAKSIHAKRVAAHRKFARDCESRAKMGAALDQMRWIDGISTEPKAIDARTMVLNLANGRLDLSRLVLGEAMEPEEVVEAAGEALGPHAPADRATICAPVRFDPRGAAPRWQAFLDMIQPDPDTQAYLRRVAGYCLTGSIAEQCCFMLQGEGANGKSTIISALSRIVGPYAGSIKIQSFLRARSGDGAGATPDIARVPGMRILRASEPRTGDELDESKIKEFTGGEPLLARHLNEGFFEFTPQAKLFVSFNRAPKIKSHDEGTWRRIHVIPFAQTIPREVRRPMDVVLADFMDEAPGILNWALQGFADWRRAGLGRPAEIENASRELREASDLIGQFLRDCCDRAPDYRVSFRALRAVADGWWEAQGLQKPSAQMLGREMGHRFLRGAAGKASDRIYHGLRIKMPGDETRPDALGKWLDVSGVRDNGGAP